MNDKYLTLLSKLFKIILLVDLFPKWGSHLAEALNQQSLPLSDEKIIISQPLTHFSFGVQNFI